MNTSILDSIIFDAKQTQEEILFDFEQNPESYINSVCQKSLDEMNEEERTEASDEIKTYIENNVSTASEKYDDLEEEYGVDGDTSRIHSEDVDREDIDA